MAKPVSPRPWKCRCFLIGLALLLPAGAAFGATATATFSVTATVLANCIVSASPLAFGNYSSLQLDATTTVTVTCTSGTTYNVGLDAGIGSGATVTTRRMSGVGTLNYTLYSDSARTTVFGNTVGTNTVAATGTGSAQPLTVYGRIPGGQYPAAGSYTDTITVTVTY
ncbi:fimbrial major subunit CsuA/B family protein [Azoarcus sp. TTM-91]|uniref:Csu type fimbrial protein n=1 Tax=Azoarcus sp. TTM-91 TaxID=2691581 RepID=UPI00145E248B|nr:spore coat U domain-containing protein [Azoarcus sp. TTM-91]NMG35433.1 fimbrial major subunit CsuA/B family protein [Azoarcus sp. TTM-91]